jgi:hypothetical protein
MTDEVHIVLNPVREDRAAGFEHFLTNTVAPAVRAQRPDLDGRWQVLRSATPANGTVTYAFLLHGGSLDDDWELNRVLPAHYGQDEAERLVGDWVETFAALGPWAEAAVEAGEDANQLAFTLRPVPV